MKYVKEDRFKSNEEQWFNDWLCELALYGLAYAIKYQPYKYDLADAVKVTETKEMKTKLKEVEKTLLRECSYSPDFSFKLSDKLHKILYDSRVSSILYQSNNPDNEFIIEVKGEFKGNNSDISAPINIKWVYKDYGIYVQLLKVVSQLFSKTFYPESYFWTTEGKERTKKVEGEFVKLKDLNYKTIDIWLKDIGLIS